MSKKGVFHNTDNEIPSRYRMTFTIPNFNPRWSCGLVDNYAVLKRNSDTNELNLVISD